MGAQRQQAPSWIRHDPRFCRSGDVFSQPVGEGLLQPGFAHSDCGSLDAPRYVPLGGIGVELFVYDDGHVIAKEETMLNREILAERAEPADQHDHAWAPDDCVYTDPDDPIVPGIPGLDVSDSDFGAFSAAAGGAQ